MRVYWIVLLDVGCRKTEGLNIQYKDIEVRKRDEGTSYYLQILPTKNAKARTVPLSKRAYLGLMSLKSEYKRTMPFEIVSDSTFRTYWRRFKKSIGMSEDSDLVTHSLRHTCLTQLVEHGADIRDVQQWAGHSTITMSARYTHPSNERLSSILTKRDEEE